MHVTHPRPHRAALTAVVVAALVGCGAETGSPSAATTVDVGRLVQQWPTSFTLSGTKGVATWVESVQVARDGDEFRLEGGAPAGDVQHVETLEVGPRGELRDPTCAGCTAEPSTGFLATAALVAAWRAGRDLGRADLAWYADRQVACIPATAFGVASLVLEPCVDVATGAVLAQRHVRSGRFEGPSLDPWSIELRP